MGAAMAEPDKIAVNIIGDYGFGMVGLDIETAVREQIPVFTIILNNSAMGIYRPENFQLQMIYTPQNTLVVISQ